MNLETSLRDLPRETLLNISEYLRIDEIQKLGLALSKPDEIILLDDDYLFKQLAQRDFEQDGTLSAEISTTWTWKQLYRALLGVRRQIIHEMEATRGLIFACHAPPLLIPPVPLRLHVIQPESDDEEDMDADFHPQNIAVKLVTSWARCVFVDEQRQLAFVPDDVDAMVASRDFINLESQQILQNRNIIEKRFNPEYMMNKAAPHGREVTFVKEGLCVWVETEKLKHCRYKLMYPMTKLRRVFDQCLSHVEKRVLARRAALDRVLGQTLILRYRVDKPGLIGQYSDLLWDRLKRIFKRAELEIVMMRIEAEVLEFTVIRKVEWVHSRLCLADDCLEMIPRKLFNTPYDHEDIFEVIRRHLCDFHLAHNHYPVQSLISQRLRYLETEQLNFFSRDFKCPEYRLNLREKFSIHINQALVLNFERVNVTIQEQPFVVD